jgi:cytochrome c oxidase subunit 2
MAGWIANPQALKPGTKMPTLRAYTGPELRALAAYMESLK